MTRDKSFCEMERDIFAEGYPRLGVRAAVAAAASVENEPEAWPGWYTRLCAAEDVLAFVPGTSKLKNVRVKAGFIPDYREWMLEEDTQSEEEVGGCEGEGGGGGRDND